MQLELRPIQQKSNITAIPGPMNRPATVATQPRIVRNVRDTAIICRI